MVCLQRNEGYVKLVVNSDGTNICGEAEESLSKPEISVLLKRYARKRPALHDKACKLINNKAHKRLTA